MRFIGVSISDLTRDEIIDDIYILRKKELKETVNKKPFIDMVLIDSTGEINGKLWETGDEFFNELT